MGSGRCGTSTTGARCCVLKSLLIASNRHPVRRDWSVVLVVGAAPTPAPTTSASRQQPPGGHEGTCQVAVLPETRYPPVGGWACRHGTIGPRVVAAAHSSPAIGAVTTPPHQCHGRGRAGRGREHQLGSLNGAPRLAPLVSHDCPRRVGGSSGSTTRSLGRGPEATPDRRARARGVRRPTTSPATTASASNTAAVPRIIGIWPPVGSGGEQRHFSGLSCRVATMDHVVMAIRRPRPGQHRPRLPRATRQPSRGRVRRTAARGTTGPAPPRARHRSAAPLPRQRPA